MIGKKIRKGLLEAISDRTGQLDLLLKEAYQTSNYDGYTELIKEWTKLVELYYKIAMEGEHEKTQ